MSHRDMSITQYRAALDRNGIKPVGFLGYYDVGNGLSVSILNLGGNASRRAKLAYLLAAQAREKSREELIEETRA